MPNSTASSRRKIWESRIQRQRHSGLTIAKFCADEGCGQASFYHWKRKLSKQQTPEPKFVAVSLPSCPTQRNSLTLPGGATIELADQLDKQQLTDLIAAVVEATTRAAEPRS